MPLADDWRRQGQEQYLKGETLSWKTYTKFREDWDHDHCEFCGTKFMVSSDSETLKEGYATSDNYTWICKQCFKDFCDEFEWEVK